MATQPHFLGSMTLKALLEDPNFINPPLINQGNQPKVKKEQGSDVPQYNYGSAFLGPSLWDKSYGNGINFEYMDLDEFLSENTIPIPEGDVLAGILNEDSAGSLQTPARSPQEAPVSSPREYLRTPPLSPSHYLKGSPAPPPSVVPSPYPIQTSMVPEAINGSAPSSPGSPSSVKVDFQVSEQDLALSNIPGVSFDPRKRNFTEEELKPQPIIKKSKKIFVPEDLKDDRYWARRHKNNFAAKRSRDARRVKENQIALRAAYLEKENKCLKEEMSKLRKENARLKNIAEKYEPDSVETCSSSSNVGTMPSWPSLTP